MNVTLRPRLTMEEFLAWEERQELRYEFDGRKAIAMVGGTEAHEIIAVNILIEVGTQLRTGPCRIYGGGMKIEVAGRIRYPDALVICSPAVAKRRLLTDPVVVFEVQSESTALIDQTVKNDEYRATPSIKRYVMLSQDSIAANIFTRNEGGWVGKLITDPTAMLAMPEIGVELPLAALYAGLDFTEAADA